MHSALIAIRNAMKIKMRGTLLRKTILIHNAENDAWDATRHAKEQTPSIHPPHQLLRQGKTKDVFHGQKERECGASVTGVSQERNRSVVCSRIPPKSGM